MKNLSNFLETRRSLAIIALAAIIAVTMTACKEDTAPTTSAPQTSARLTVNGLSAHNGKYIYVMGEIGQRTFAAADNISYVGTIENGTITGTSISGGTASLKVWEVAQDGTITAFAGNLSGVTFTAIIFNQQTITQSSSPAAQSNGVNGNFSGGSAAITISSWQ